MCAHADQMSLSRLGSHLQDGRYLHNESKADGGRAHIEDLSLLQVPLVPLAAPYPTCHNFIFRKPTDWPFFFICSRQ